MIIKKIGVVTGHPFDMNLYNKTVLIDNVNAFYVVDGAGLILQSNLKDEGYRQATLEKIQRDWKFIHKYWQPQIGDKVQIVQKPFQCSGFIKDKGQCDNNDYWLIDRTDNTPEYFDKRDQMVIHPEHGWNVSVQENQEPEMNPKEKLYNSLKDKVKEELKLIDPELKEEIIEACVNQPKESYSNQENLLNLIGEFTWCNTEQGMIYWDNIFKYLTYNNGPKKKFTIYTKFKKTVRKELDRLKEPVRERILEVFYDRIGNFESYNSSFFKHNLYPLLGSIFWRDLKEGYVYWKKVYDKLVEDKHEEIEKFKEEEVDFSLKISDCSIDLIFLSLKKEVKDELKKIPSSVKDDILYNIKHHCGALRDLECIFKLKNLSDLLGSGFVWENTIQGSYWSVMQNYAYQKKYSSIVPYSDYIKLKEDSNISTVKVNTADSANSSSIRHDFISDSTSILDFSNSLKVNPWTIYGQKSLIDELRKCPTAFIEEIIKEYGYFYTLGSTIIIAESNLSIIVNTFYYSYFNPYWKEMLELLLNKKYYLLCSKQSYYDSKKSSSQTTTTSEVIIFNQPNRKNYLSVDSSKYDQTPLRIKQKPKIKLKLN